MSLAHSQRHLILEFHTFYINHLAQVSKNIKQSSKKIVKIKRI